VPEQRFSHAQLLLYAGLFTYGCLGLLMLVLKLGAEPSRLLLWANYLIFGASYFLLLSEGIKKQRLVNFVLLALMSMAALTITYVTQSGLGSVLLMVSAAAIAYTLELRVAVLVMLAQNLAFLPILASQPKLSLLEAMLMVAMYLGCSIFVFMTAWIGKRQMQARAQLYQVNLELRATQAMLSDTERNAERLRISRELHDLVGHHLTALALNLEVATHITQGKARQHVQQAQTISKLLLSDVREVVSTLREGDPIHLDRTLKAMVADIPKPIVHLTMPEPFTLSDASRGHALLRLTQELLTNAIKHSGARNLWLRFQWRDTGIEVSAHDDGRGTELLKAGNGLAGMTERLHAFGGTLICESTPGRGFNVAAFLPLRAGQSIPPQSLTFTASEKSQGNLSVGGVNDHTARSGLA
jgi:signal transduction histidine kinase